MGFGIREPAIVGIIALRLPAAIDIAALDRRMAQEIDEAPPEDAGDPDALRLARRIAFYACALQRRAQVPVFGVPFIHSPHPRDGAELFRLALPCYAVPAVTEALAWVAAAISSFLDTAELHEGTAERICAALKDHAPRGINTYRLLATANELGIPVRQLVPGVFRLRPWRAGALAGKHLHRSDRRHRRADRRRQVPDREPAPHRRPRCGDA